jgi:hypothetical protein
MALDFAEHNAKSSYWITGLFLSLLVERQLFSDWINRNTVCLPIKVNRHAV